MMSSLTSGERRWASARRGGMTVLGKVAVPKPINLPSQRLENHGLDPNVEIVPKGTLSWGSRPSSAGSNAWGSSALSPNTDGSSSSPSHLVGRPSSGGDTRPSTAGSDRAHDSNVNVWSSNSRPSSASGVVASNNPSVKSLRPHSSETRPGSSQLSRFAEPATENSGAWNSGATSEQIRVSNCGKDGFSLSSGDFPTLGSEKGETRKNAEALDHASDRLPSSSGLTTMSESIGTSRGDDISRNADFSGNSWRKDGSPHVEDGPRSSMERSYGQPFPCHNSHMAPPHYESWRGALPVNPPGRVWYRGPPGPPPYGAPGAHGSFPMDPFPHYRPLVPAPGLANSQSIPSPGVGPHGHLSKNGDMYRPQMPEPYIRPGMPIRPGFYPGTVPFEGYFGPPMGFCNPNERDLSFMGMVTGPHVYNRPVNPSVPEPNKSHPKHGDDRALDQVESGHPHDPSGRYKCLRGQNDGWNQNDENMWGNKVTIVASNCEKGVLSKASWQENACGDDYKKDEDMHYGKFSAFEEVPSQSIENKAIPDNLMFSGSMNNVEGAATSAGKEDVSTPRGHSLIQKIEGLNAKARSSGGRQDSSNREEPHGRVQIVNARVSQSAIDVNSNIVLERHYPSGVPVPVSYDIRIATENRSHEITNLSATAAPRKPTHGAQNWSDHHGQVPDRWRKNSEFGIVVSAAGSGPNINDQVAEHHAVVHPAKVPKPIVVKKSDGESVISTSDPSDTQSAKMRERTKQRAIQLQKEEEERIQEQKAKALAKLDELNCHSANQATEGAGYKVESVPPDSFTSHKQEDSRKNLEPMFDANRMSVSSSVTANIIVQANERGDSNYVDSTISLKHVDAEAKKTAYRDSFLLQNQLQADDVNFSDAAGHSTVPQVREVSKQKRAGHKQRQSIPPEKNSTKNLIPSGRGDGVKDIKDSGATEQIADGEVSSGAGRELAESHQMSGSSVHQKKKSTTGKNKHKVGDPSKAISLSGYVAKDSNYAEAIGESVEQSDPDLNIKTISLSGDASSASQSSEIHSSSSREDAHGRQKNLWKPQNSRKSRNSQGNGLSEKSHSNDSIVWAPVRSHNKVEATDQTCKKATEPSVSSVTGDNVAISSPKTRRAEMERYVPKHVAKELAQHGSIQHSPSPLVDQAEADGTVQRVKASLGSDYVEKAHSVVEYKHVDGNHQHRAQGSWRQCVPSESIPVQASRDSFSSAANINKNIETSNRSEQTAKSDKSLVGEPPSGYVAPSAKGPQINVSDRWNQANDSGSTMSAGLPGARDHVPSGRERRPFKGRKGSGNNQNNDYQDTNVTLTDLQHLPVEASQTERTVPSKEVQEVGDRATSHWQPKSQGYVTHNQQGDRSCDQNIIAEESKVVKVATGHNGDSYPLSQNDQTSAGDTVACEDKDLGGGISSLRHQENKRDKKGPPVRGRPHYSQGPVGEVEPSSYGSTWGHNDRRPSGYRKYANNGGRFDKGQESRGDWSLTAEENKQHHSSTNQEKPRLHYKYQPVGSYNNSSGSRSNESGAQTGDQPGVPRFHERGQSHSRRGKGSFYGRQKG